MTTRRVFILFLIIASAVALSADGEVQTPDNKGSDFFLALPQNAVPASTAQKLTLFLAAEAPTKVEISGPEVIPTTFSIPDPSSPTSFVLAVEFENTSPQASTINRVAAEGIRVRSVDASDPTLEGAPIAVYAMNRRPAGMGGTASTAAYVALPVDALGSAYRALSRPTTSQVTIVGTEANTIVTITSPVAVQNVTVAGVTFNVVPGVPFNIGLNPLQTFLLQASPGMGDLSGTLVTANKPIAVFSGNQNSGVNGGSADHMVEQMVPVSTWGKEFLVAPIAPNTSGTSVVRVLAHEDDTEVEVNGDLKATLKAGKVHEFSLSSTAHSWVKTSKPSLVAQYKRGDAIVVDPFLMLVPPVTQFSRQYLFRTPAAPFSNWLNIVAKAGEEVNLRLNNQELPAGTVWTTVNGYRYARVQIDVGKDQDLQHQDPAVRFGAWAYGHASGEGYGFAAGQLVTDETAPVVASVPDDLTVEATGPDGAPVTWDDPTATDFGRGDLPVTCGPGTGDVFELGMHVVDCSATDPAGNTTTESFNVTVKDTTPPELTVADVLVHATGPNGAVVPYDQVTATDIVDLDNVSINCAPASGSTFALGPQQLTSSTSVSCTATDQSGNESAAQTFTVIVTNGAPVCSGAPSISRIWPPNHQMVPVSVNGVTDADDDGVTIRVDSIFQDEPTNSVGDGNTPIDGVGVGTSVAQVRAERSGGGNGRVYLIRYTATDSIGASCSGAVTVGVPHDQGPKGGPVDDGAVYDSTGP